MSILNGPYASKMRGKVGEVVAAKTVGGQTALRSYQPNVKNPNTVRQRAARDRFSVISGIAASLANVISIGYGKAVQGMKMYPRNLWVKQMYPLFTSIETDGRDIESIIWPEIPISMQSGIAVKPVAVYTAGTKTISFSNTADVVLPAGQQLGAVVLLVDDDLTSVAVLTGAANAGIVVPDALAESGLGHNILVFYKAIEMSGTTVPTDQWPWKYPSATSATYYAGKIPE